VPAMGSHGGGTAEGQQKIVETFGITEAFVGCPIRSSVETVVIGRSPDGFPLHFDRAAFEADGNGWVPLAACPAVLVALLFSFIFPPLIQSSLSRC